MHPLLSFSTKKFNLLVIIAVAAVSSSCGQVHSENKATADSTAVPAKTKTDTIEAGIPVGPIDTAAYNQFLVAMTNKDSSGKWPVNTFRRN